MRIWAVWGDFAFEFFTQTVVDERFDAMRRLTANVTEPAKGFSVLTPRATVVDLGTESGVEVNNDGATDVVVFKGEVDDDYNDPTDQSSAQRLRIGEAVHLGAIGMANRIVSVNGLATHPTRH